MRRTVDGIPYWLTVVSRGRPQNVHTMEAKIGPATWYVPEAQMAAYAEMSDGGSNFVAADEYPANRNVALKDGWRQALVVVQMDDDLKGFKLALKGKGIPTDADTALGEMLGTLMLSDYKLGGMAPTANAFYANEHRPTSHNLFVCAQCFAVKPCDLLFDETMRLKADYDYTIRHWLSYGGVCRLNLVLPEFQHYGNPGGCVDYRTSEGMQAANRALIDRYPGFIIPNTKRGDDEIILRLPRDRRASLP